MEVLLVDVFGQNALIKMYNDDLTLFLGLLVVTNILLEILFSEILLDFYLQLNYKIFFEKGN